MSTKPKRRTVALLTHALDNQGGISRVTEFLYTALAATSDLAPDVIGVATSAMDENSVQVTRPSGWMRGPRVSDHQWKHIRWSKVGSSLSEFEFQRYRPRPILTEILTRYDVIQVIAGAPALALAAMEAGRPVSLQVATRVRVERSALLMGRLDLKKLWQHAMTRIVSAMETSAIRRSNLVFVENPWMYLWATGIAPRDRVRLAPPGVDTEAFCPSEYDASGYFLSVGRFNDPRKNVRLLFKTYAGIRKISKGAIPNLVLVGQQPLQADWDYARDLEIQTYVKVLSSIDDKTLVETYQSASIFLLSSDEEGLGLVVLEAMSCGLPVVATRCGGPEMIINTPDCGLLTAVGDSEAFLEAVVKLWEDPTARRRMGSMARSRIEQSFSRSVTAQHYLEGIRSLLAS